MSSFPFQTPLLLGQGIYNTASLILEKIEKFNLLKREFARPEFKDYDLVVTGHSLGAGVASVLSVILKRDYPNLKCYAFSPPGCIFRYITYSGSDYVRFHGVAVFNNPSPNIDSFFCGAKIT